MGVTSHVSDKGMKENRMFIALTLMVMLATMASTPAAAEQKETEPGCISGEKGTSFRAGWLEKSDAICAYDFAEFNRRISRFIEAPLGTFTPKISQQYLARRRWWYGRGSARIVSTSSTPPTTKSLPASLDGMH